MSSRPRTTLRDKVDRDVYQIVRRLEEGSRKPLSVSSVYDSIKNSNSSLARQKRRPLEDAIDRVLDYRREEVKADEEAEDSDLALERKMAADAKAAEEKAAARSERDRFLLNRQMTKHWNFGQGPKLVPGMDPVANGVPTPEGEQTAPSGVDTPMDGAAARMEIDEPVERQPNGEPKLKRKRRSRVDRPPVPTPTAPRSYLRDLGGMDYLWPTVQKMILVPLCEVAEFGRINYTMQSSLLLQGPSGTGKTALVRALAAAMPVAFVPVSATSLVSGISGESEKNIREAFDEAVRLAPSVLFIDDIDVIAARTDSAQKAMEVRMASELSQGLDKIALCATSERNIVVIAATNRPDTIEPTVRRRFQEVEITMPDEAGRAEILRTMTRNMPLDDDVDFEVLARLTSGYVGADLKTAVNQAAAAMVEESFKERMARASAADATTDSSKPQSWFSQLDDLVPSLMTTTDPIDPINPTEPNPTADNTTQPDRRRALSLAHFKAGISKVQPAAKREGFSTVPNTTWAQIGALHKVRRQLELAIVKPIEHPERFAALGMKPAAGILLWGPPGCGKTLVAKAVANASKANFISIKGPELLNKYVGESEHNVRQLFSRAKASAPCVLFFDELDALAPTRDFSMSGATSRVVNALLTELDGIDDRAGIYVVGATNRPDAIDEAIRRPGRLGTEIYVGLPTPDDRADILRAIYETTIPGGRASDATRATINRVARDDRCGRFTGADLRQLLTAASEACLVRDALVISDEDWEVALQEVKPSVKDLDKYLEAMTARDL